MKGFGGVGCGIREMKGERKYSCQLSRKIVERAQMKKKGVNTYHKAVTFGKGLLYSGKLGNNGLNFGKGECFKSCSASQSCFGKVTLQNYENFRKSSEPARVMYFWSGAWNDFSPLASNSLREAFSAGMPSVEVVIDGSPYLVDFLRMLQVDLRAGCQRSIAWIDKKGSCFFPKFVIEDNVDGEEGSPKFEVEIEIRISPTEASNTKRCGVGVVSKKAPEISEVSKTKKDCHPRYLETSKSQKLGFTMNMEGMSNLLTPKPPSKVACMDQTKADQLTGDSSTKVLTPVNEFDKRAQMQISSDEVGNGSPNCTSQSESSSKSQKQKRGLTMNKERISNVLTPSPPKVACMDQTKADQLTGNSSTKVLTPPNEMDKRGQISSDEVVNGTLNFPSQSESNSVVATVFEHLGDKLIKLREWDEEFVAVRNKFLDGPRKVDLATTITGIYKNSHASALGQARLQAFHKQIEITKNSRGNANVRYAWHGTSHICVSTIIVHGFSHSRVLDNGITFGVGVYLSPEDRPYLSVPFSGVDKNDEQHMVLCRVILGNVEKVPLGSRQFHPSCEKFDSGVDDLTTPKYHIVWSTHMNTHILPEYVISFKAPHRFHGCWGGLKANAVPFDISKSPSNQYAQAADQQSVYQPVPRKESGGIASLANMSFLKLLSIIRKHLPNASVKSLEHIYNEYKVGRIGKDIFIKRVRMIAGDKLLISIIRSLREHAKFIRMPNILKNCQQDIGGSKRLNVKTEFTTFSNQKDQVQIGRAEPATQTFLASRRQTTEDQFTVSMDKSVLDLQSSSKHEFVLDRQSVHCKNEHSSKMSGHM